MNLARYLQKSIRIEKKILKYTSHQNFIAHCIQESVVPKGFQIKWNICLDTTDSDKDRYRNILFRSSIQLMHAALRTCEENLKQFKLKFDRLTTEIEELYGFDGTKQLNIILSSVREKTMRDLERTKERKFRKYAQTLDPRYKSSDKSMEYDNTKITTNDTFYYNAQINGQKCMNRVLNTQNSKIESNRNGFIIGRQSSEVDRNTKNKPEMKTNRLTEIKNKEHELKSQHQLENAFDKKNRVCRI